MFQVIGHHGKLKKGGRPQVAVSIVVLREASLQVEGHCRPGNSRPGYCHESGLILKLIKGTTTPVNMRSIAFQMGARCVLE